VVVGVLVGGLGGVGVVGGVGEKRILKRSEKPYAPLGETEKSGKKKRHIPRSIT